MGTSAALNEGETINNGAEEIADRHPSEGVDSLQSLTGVGLFQAYPATAPVYSVAVY